MYLDRFVERYQARLLAKMYQKMNIGEKKKVYSPDVYSDRSQILVLTLDNIFASYIISDRLCILLYTYGGISLHYMIIFFQENGLNFLSDHQDSLLKYPN